MPQPGSKSLRLTPLSIALLYAVFAALWISSGDFLLAQLSVDKDVLTILQFLKGSVLFVAVTAVMLYLLIRKLSLQIEATQRSQRSLMNNLPGMAYQCDADADYTMNIVSPGCESVTGYTAAELVEGSVKFVTLIHPEDRVWVSDTLRAISPAHPRFAMTYRIQRKDGRVRWVWEQGNGIWIDGALIALEGYISDITDKEEARRALAAKESQFRSLIENAPDLILLCQPDGAITFGSPSVERVIGLRDENLTMENVFDLVHPLDRLTAEVFFTTIMDAPETAQPIEMRLRNRDGAWSNIEFVGKVIHRESTPTVVLNGRDITERLERESEIALLAYAVNQSGDAVAIAGADGAIRYANDAFVAATGYSTIDLESRNLAMLFPGGFEQEPDSVWERCKTGAPWAGVATCVSKDCRRVRMRGSIVPINNSHGAVTSFVAILCDVTQQEEDASRVQQRQKMEAIGTLAGGIAHDFNNILAAILGYTEIALEQLPKDSPLEVDLRAVLTAGHRGRDLVRRILTFSRDKQHQPEAVYMPKVISESIDLLRATIPSSISIEEVVHTDCCPIYGDRTQMQQVLINLCTNAAHAMREDGGHLTITLRQDHLGPQEVKQFGDLGEGSFVVLEVKDTGHGMDRATINRVFEPFYTTKVDEGTGLGLSTVHGIVRAHGGGVMVESEVGKGSTFTVAIPAMRQEVPATGPKAAPQENTVGAQEHVLFIDDEKALVSLSKKMLERYGYRVTAMGSGTEALEQLALRPAAFDVIVTDQSMPQLTGLAVAEQARQIRPDIPIIIMTGYSDANTEQRALELGVHAVLMKPVISKDLAGAIRSAIAARPLVDPV